MLSPKYIVKTILLLLLSGIIVPISAQRNGRYVKRYNLFHKHILGHYKNGKKTGEWIEWNRDRTIRSIEYYEEGLRDGPYIHNMDKISGNYKMGKKEGRWKYQQQTGVDSFVTYQDGLEQGAWWTTREGYGNTKLSQGSFKDGLPDSNFIIKTNGYPVQEGGYRLGKRTGKWTYYVYGSNTTKQKEEFYMNDSLVKRITYYPYASWNTKQETEEFMNGKVVRKQVVAWYNALNKEREEFYSDRDGSGKLLKDSLWTTWNKSGQVLSSTLWKGGRRHGEESLYNDKGGLLSQVSYRDGIKDGAFTFYFSGGGKRESGNYTAGLLNGPFTKYYPDGNFERKCVYVHDTLNGLCMYYYPSGKIKSEMNYTGGVLDGTYRLWDENGKVITTQTYKSKDGKKEPDPKGQDRLKQAGNTGSIPVVEEKKEDQIFTVVEQMPEFPGGQEEFYKYLTSNLKYPELEKEAGISGKVFMTFMVDVDGKVRDIKVLKGVVNGPGLEKEAIRVLSKMPDWIPGKRNGKPVRVSMNIPVNFKIQ